MQELGINSGTAPIVRRPEEPSTFDLTFEGTRDVKVRDRHGGAAVAPTREQLMDLEKAPGGRLG